MMYSVQTLRSVAAIMVVTFHAHLFLSGALRSTNAIETYLFEFGSAGVHVFFVISGYIMYLTNLKRIEPFVPSRFMLRRFIRIYPMYWLFAALYTLTHYEYGSPYKLTVTELLATLALLPGYASHVIGPAWTLTFELYFYAVFAGCMMLGVNRGLIMITVIFAASALLGQLVGFTNPLASLMTNTLLLEFVAGLWVARLTTATDFSRKTGWSVMLGALALFAGGLAFGYDRGPSALVWGLPSALLLAGCVILERSGGLPGARRWSALGDSSYSLYLGHLLLVDFAVMLMRRAGWEGSAMSYAAVVTVASVGLAHMFFLIVERRLVMKLNVSVSRWRMRTGMVAATM